MKSERFEVLKCEEFDIKKTVESLQTGPHFHFSIFFYIFNFEKMLYHI